MTSPKPPPTTVRVTCRNSAGLLRQMSGIFASHGINIQNMQATTTEDYRGVCTFGVSTRSPAQLEKLMVELRRLRDVVDVSASE